MFSDVQAICERDTSSCRVTADPARLEEAYAQLPKHLPQTGLGEEGDPRDAMHDTTSID